MATWPARVLISILRPLVVPATCLVALPALAVDIIAHRGASHDAPENTMASVRLGWEQQADAVEIDIYLTKDGRIAVVHDADTKRTTGVPGKIAERTWDELAVLDAGSWKDPRWKGERIPSLEPILATIPVDKRLLIEIKCGPEVLPELERVLNAAKLPPRQTVLIGFDYDTMVAARQRFPALAVHWLSAFKTDAQTKAVTPTVETLIAKARAGRLTGVSVNYKGPIDAAFVRAVKAAGLQCHVWTVNEAAIARRLRSAGVDSITTDRPGWLREQLKQTVP